MSTTVWLQTTDGRLVQGINYSVDAATLPTDPATMAAGMQGGMTAGVYHLRTPLGWVYVPASQINAVQASAGAPT